MNEKYILINSKYRTNGDSNNFRLYLNKNIQINEYIQINYLNIARCNYLINEKNNKFDILFDDGTILTIILNHQNYSPLQFVSYLNIQINNYNNLKIIYNDQTYKFQFISTTNNFRLDFSKTEIYKLFSLEKKIYSSDRFVFYSNIVNFNNPFYIQLNIKNIVGNDFINTTSNYSSLHFVIPCVNTNFGEIISYNKNIYDIKMYVDQVNINYIDIELLDDENNLFNNQNIDWYCILNYK